MNKITCLVNNSHLTLKKDIEKSANQTLQFSRKKQINTTLQISVSARYVRELLLVVFGFNGPLRQYFSLYRAVPQREGEKEKR